MNDTPLTRILMVDDESSILSSFKRGLRRCYQVDTAESGEQGLSMLKEHEYKVIVSDYNMPEMNGGEFLGQSIDISPDSVRVLLTGYADFEAVVRCVNEGLIFRFLTKPCESDTMKSILEACIKQHDLIKSESELLEKTLDGSIKMLSEILSLANPETFSYSNRINHFVESLVKNLQLENKWLYKIASRLSQLGMIVLDDELINTIASGQNLAKTQSTEYHQALKVGAELIAKIPRLETISEIIYQQDTESSSLKINHQKPLNENDTISIGVHLIHAAKFYDKQMNTQGDVGDVIEKMELTSDSWHPDITTAIKQLSVFNARESRQVKINQLTPKMTIAQDIRTKTDLMLISKGQQVTDTIIARLNTFLKSDSIDDVVKVLI